MYTSEDKYLTKHGSILPQPNPTNPNEPMSEAFVREIRFRVLEYFEIVYKNLRDSIPKAIGQMLLNESSQQMQVKIFEAVQKD